LNAKSEIFGDQLSKKQGLALADMPGLLPLFTDGE